MDFLFDLINFRNCLVGFEIFNNFVEKDKFNDLLNL